MSRDNLAQQQRNHPETGFTLVETMITLTIAAILLAAAAPSMQDFITRNRMSVEVNTFVASLYLARSEAVKRLQNVKVCPATFDSAGNVNGCTGGTDWESGWVVYADLNQDGNFTSGSDAVLQQNPALPARFNIIGDSGRLSATFQSTGQASGSNNTFQFCDTGGIANTREVILSNEGRVRVNQLTTSGCVIASGGGSGSSTSSSSGSSTSSSGSSTSSGSGSSTSSSGSSTSSGSSGGWGW